MKFLQTLLFMLIFSPVFCQIPVACAVKETTEISIENSDWLEQYSVELKINNPNGEKYSTVSVPYSNLLKLSNLKVWIKDKNGKIIRELKKSEFKERNNPEWFSLYEDSYVKEFTARNNEYPYFVCYSFTRQQNQFTEIADWVPIYRYEIPTENAVLKISLPSNYKINIHKQFIDSLKIDSSQGITVYQIHSSYKNIYKHQTFSPPILDSLPEIEMIPAKFYFVKPGESKTWVSLGNWYQDILRGLNDLPENEKLKIHSVSDNIADSVEKIKALYHYLQDNTRYINVSVETGGLKPYPASYVAANKYGDCKALTNYFKSVLECVGIKSCYTIVNAGKEIEKINTDFPSFHFNHIILLVPLKKDTIWLDCTSKYPFGYLGTFTQNRFAFVTEKDNSKLIKTSELTAGQVTENRKAEIEIEPDNSVQLKVKQICGGYEFELLDQVSRDFSESDKTRIISENFMPEGVNFSDYKISKPERDTPEIIFDYNATTNQFIKEYGKETLIKMLEFKIPYFEYPTQRKLPVQINFPIHQIDTLEYKLPEGYTYSNSLKMKEISGKFGNYKFDFSIKGNKIQIVKEFTLFAGNYPIQMYADFYKFVYFAFSNEKKSYIVLQKK
jgi:hypothetical protein